MTSNIDILYTFGKNFSPRVRIRDRYFKMKLCLARINWQSLLFLNEKSCRRSGHFRRERRVTLEWGGQDEMIDTQKQRWEWLEMAFHRGFPTCELPPIGVLWLVPAGVCVSTHRPRLWSQESWELAVLERERERGGGGRLGEEEREMSGEKTKLGYKLGTVTC